MKIKFFKIENCIIIFSEKRGGSTWLAQILENIDNTVINWEPLNGYGSIPKKINLGEKPYLPRKYQSKKMKKIFLQVLTLRLHTKYTRTFISIKKIIHAKFVLTKFVGANMISEWLIYNFQFKYRPIFLIRNPIDCCSSQLITFSKWITDEYQLKVNNSLNSERFNREMEFLKSLDSKLERQIAIWCINNVPVINSKFIKQNCIIVYYENLLLNTENETCRILTELGIPKENYKNPNKNLSKPSFSNFNNDLKKDKQEQLTKNLIALSKVEKDNIQKIYNHFNFNLYSAYSPFPINA